MSTPIRVRSTRSVSRESECPECRSSLEMAAPTVPGKHYLCQKCAAISIAGRDGYPRLLRTEEWLAILHAPDFLELLEQREPIIERLTAAAVRA